MTYPEWVGKLSCNKTFVKTILHKKEWYLIYMMYNANHVKEHLELLQVNAFQNGVKVRLITIGIMYSLHVLTVNTHVIYYHTLLPNHQCVVIVTMNVVFIVLYKGNDVWCIIMH